MTLYIIYTLLILIFTALVIAMTLAIGHNTKSKRIVWSYNQWRRRIDTE